MQNIKTPAQEAAEDIFFGQVVIIWARWFVILAAAISVLWVATTVQELTIAVLPIVALMAMNFYVHGRYLMERPVNPVFLSVISLLDLVVITAMVLVWPGRSGLDSPYFVFYYPITLAFAFVFPPSRTVLYTGAAIVAYTVASLIAHPSFLGDADQVNLLVMRIIPLAAMGGLGTFYWRIQRQRRREASGGLLTAPREPLDLPSRMG